MLFNNFLEDELKTEWRKEENGCESLSQKGNPGKRCLHKLRLMRLALGLQQGVGKYNYYCLLCLYLLFKGDAKPGKKHNHRVKQQPESTQSMIYREMRTAKLLLTLNTVVSHKYWTIESAIGDLNPGSPINWMLVSSHFHIFSSAPAVSLESLTHNSSSSM